MRSSLNYYRAVVGPSGAQGVTQCPNGHPDQHQSPGWAERTGTPAGWATTTPGVVNRKFNVPTKSTMARALPTIEARGETGRSAMSRAVMIAIVPNPRATVVALVK
jgi:hypothetical protein